MHCLRGGHPIVDEQMVGVVNVQAVGVVQDLALAIMVAMDNDKTNS